MRQDEKKHVFNCNFNELERMVGCLEKDMAYGRKQNLKSDVVNIEKRLNKLEEIVFDYDIHRQQRKCP